MNKNIEETSKEKIGNTKSKQNASKKENAANNERDAHHDRHQMIQIAAYYYAEKRSFSGDEQMLDWLVAEKEIDEHLGKSKNTKGK